MKLCTGQYECYSSLCCLFYPIVVLHLLHLSTSPKILKKLAHKMSSFCANVGKKSRIELAPPWDLPQAARLLPLMHVILAMLDSWAKLAHKLAFAYALNYLEGQTILYLDERKFLFQWDFTHFTAEKQDLFHQFFYQTFS